MSDEVYSPGQAGHVLPYLDGTFRWFLLAGPADGDEAQTVKAARPDIRVIGFEPCEEFYRTQLRRNFPGEILNAALWNATTQLSLRRKSDDLKGLRGGSVVHQRPLEVGPVPAYSLDHLDPIYGPFYDAFLWIDVEGAERQVIEGAKELLETGRIRAMNVEVFSHQEQEFSDLLAGFGFREVDRWGCHKQAERAWCNIIYKKD